jgi:hypothetical protein
MLSGTAIKEVQQQIKTGRIHILEVPGHLIYPAVTLICNINRDK